MDDSKLERALVTVLDRRIKRRPIPAWALDVLLVDAQQRHWYTDKRTPREKTKDRRRSSDADCYEMVKALRSRGVKWEHVYDEAGQHLKMSPGYVKNGYCRANKLAKAGNLYLV